jgi:hypothetical protein
MFITTQRGFGKVTSAEQVLRKSKTARGKSEIKVQWKRLVGETAAFRSTQRAYRSSRRFEFHVVTSCVHSLWFSRSGSLISSQHLSFGPPTSVLCEKEGSLWIGGNIQRVDTCRWWNVFWSSIECNAWRSWPISVSRTTGLLELQYKLRLFHDSKVRHFDGQLQRTNQRWPRVSFKRRKT